ncbi:unnamed protein product, partial [marine sediment metagenome]
AILHSNFLPGITGDKMSTSKPNSAIFLSDDEKTIRKKIGKAFSGGQETIEEHRKKGGNPEVDIACIYLKHLFLSPEEYKSIEKDYKSGKLLSGEVKKLFADKSVEFIKTFQDNLKKVDDKVVDKSILRNE